ncbi:D-alanyl-D-alanine carboxypeptidase/D-alanyl-D-alanine endopeptidase [Defluviimonas salinarum]|uniref:D-alanyl-D-alanine carboxypeptidase/D-alanyl-D-alanine-endopeptidase n=1 Tax=Defluviimonas salinarum TaxID=2992147 RepID=A0ABT3J997_9RHOB|nr:D-alanyl-D-alanine carboxypeptidase/D-alanyl-D-alanine-endopeptidase [Defluviimonas salinarum]MCW3784257.1 D-alanyl-D-alanine carboxypeptidase/D-alanyl-D-alanine-endopeptidase [Defluviimonas salinarum]
MTEDPATRVSRRFVLSGLAACGAGAAWAEAPLSSPRPVARAGLAGAPANAAVAADLIAAARLTGDVGYVVADAATGEVLEARGGDRPMPPASTAKVITSLYALAHLGAAHRFTTRLIATGPVSGGRVEGDLVLAGGGDPELSTDDLGDMVAALAAAGVREVSGRFLVWGGALPYLEAIDVSQPDWLGYNPAVSGLNLNFNRVNFVWKREGSGYNVGMDARAARFAPEVHSATVKVADRSGPIYTYQNGGSVEEWTVARAALGKEGSRWLPVRRPDLYAGDVFHTLARAQGVALAEPEVATAMPTGTVVAQRESRELVTILRDMMKYSTNMTAEAVGMAASLRRGASSHVASGREMAAWLGAEAGTTTARFADHSGLAGASRISAADMVQVLVRLGRGAGIQGLMKPVKFKDSKGRRVANPPVKAVAKTGTLNFVSTLAGYVTAPGERELAFAIFTGDIARRDAVPEAQRERPEGSRAWIGRSRRLQQDLIERWAAVYSA